MPKNIIYIGIIVIIAILSFLVGRFTNSSNIAEIKQLKTNLQAAEQTINTLKDSESKITELNKELQITVDNYEAIYNSLNSNNLEAERLIKEIESIILEE